MKEAGSFSVDSFRPLLPRVLRNAPIYWLGDAVFPVGGVHHVPEVDPASIDIAVVGAWRAAHPSAHALGDRTIRNVVARRLSMIEAVERAADRGNFPFLVLRGALRQERVAPLPPMPSTWRVALLEGERARPFKGVGWKRAEQNGLTTCRAIAVRDAEAARAVVDELRANLGVDRDFQSIPDLAMQVVQIVPPILDRTFARAVDGPSIDAPAVWWISRSQATEEQEWTETELADWPGPVHRVVYSAPKAVLPVPETSQPDSQRALRARRSASQAEQARMRAHRVAIDAIVEGQRYPALVIEDGAFLPRREEIDPGPPQWELLVISNEGDVPASGSLHGRWRRSLVRHHESVTGYAVGNAYIATSLADLCAADRATVWMVLRRLDLWALIYVTSNRWQPDGSHDPGAASSCGGSNPTLATTPAVGLELRGDFLETTGYSHHSWELLKGLHKLGVPMTVRTKIDGSGEHAGRDRALLRALEREIETGISLQFCMPPAIDFIPGKRIVNHTMFETSTAPATWAVIGNACDLVIVPAPFLERAWIDAGLHPDRIAVVPLGIDDALFGQTAVPMDIRTESGEPISGIRHRFLNVSEIGTRKNLIGLIRAWLLGTRADDDAVLILKLSDYYNAMPRLLREIARMEEVHSISRERAAPIVFVHDFFADTDMPRLYASATHYLSLSHGEGWDNCTMEATASGLTPIVPNHSAYPAYLDEDCAHLIPSVEAPAVWPGTGPMARLFRGLHWWDPSVDDAAAIIRDVIDGRAPVKASARERILCDFSWDRASMLLREALRTRVGLS